MFLLRWALIALVLAIIAAILGFGNLAAGLGDVARVLFFIFLAIVAILVILGLTVYREIRGPRDIE